MAKGYTNEMKRVSLKPFLICILGLLSCTIEPEPGAIPTTVAVSTGPVVQEDPANSPDLDRVAIRHILISHTGARQGSPYNSRSEAQAKSLIGKIRERLLQGESMTALAKQYSDDPSGSRGGFLGASERGAWVKPFEEEAFSLKLNQISDVVRTPYGFHVLRREALLEVKLYHLVVAHKLAKSVGKRPTIRARSVAEAQRIASEALSALDGGEPFVEVANRVSDGALGKRGAELGWFVRGELGPEFDAVAFDLEIGDHSRVIETVFGFHLIERAAP
jgi:parvulin-like peptidyl-prolyl isomerase